MGNPAFFANVSNAAASREFMQWLQAQFDQPLGQMIVTDDAIPPAMKKNGTIIWRSTSLDKVYIVHFDGVSRYYWESSGSSD